MGALPPVDQDGFEDFSGLILSPEEWERVEKLVDRARRNLNRVLDLTSESLTDDDNADLADAQAELAWFYWEGEKAGAMEILALPVSQLSLGTLFWTKATGRSTLGAVEVVLGQWGARQGRGRIALEGELGHPETIVS